MNKFGFKGILFILVFVFLGLYFTGVSGYYEYEERKKVNLTNDQIEKFEKDINDGNYIDLERYLKKNKKDYSTKISNISLNTSKNIEKVFNKTMQYIFKSLDRMILE
ncbi:MAG: hypothetical protein RSC85_01670 [Bacilli bacterium]